MRGSIYDSPAEIRVARRELSFYSTVVLSVKGSYHTLRISERTAKFHLLNIFLKLAVNSRAALVERADAATHPPPHMIKAGHA